MKKFVFILLFCCSQLFAQEPESLVNWMSLEEAMEKVKTQPKPVLIDFYTDWCGWCKTMMKNTYSNPNIAQYINTYFYAVKFNAEGKDTINYLGVKYTPVSKEERATHPLAAKLLNNKFVYPTTLFLYGYDNEKMEFKLNMLASGYLEPQKIEPILIFTLENVGRNSTYDEFIPRFNEAFYDSTITEKQKKVNWQKPKDVFEKAAGDKKTLVFINSTWCTSCRVMKLTTFIDSSLNEYLNEKFNLVDFDPEISDTITFKDQKFVNQKNAQAPFHQLAMALGKNSITFPSLVVLNEKMDIIEVAPSYIPPTLMNNLLHYYGDNIYKEKTWVDFMKLKKVN